MGGGSPPGVAPAVVRALRRTSETQPAPGGMAGAWRWPASDPEAARPGPDRLAHARSVVALGASAGGIEALRCVLAALPADFDAAVLVVLHTARDFETRLPEVLGRGIALPTAHA